MAVAKCVTVSGVAREDSFGGIRLAPKRFGCPVHSRLEQWPAAKASARNRRRALVELLLVHAKGHAGPAASAHCIAVASGRFSGRRRPFATTAALRWGPAARARAASWSTRRISPEARNMRSNASR
jgi:hypothetical protein